MGVVDNEESFIEMGRRMDSFLVIYYLLSSIGAMMALFIRGPLSDDKI